MNWWRILLSALGFYLENLGRSSLLQEKVIGNCPYLWKKADHVHEHVHVNVDVDVIVHVLWSAVAVVRTNGCKA
jgi:hypothetical protein